MIETSLIYIHALRSNPSFVGCGVLIEGGYVATCRHVWSIAINGLPSNELKVEIEYPSSSGTGAPFRVQGCLAEACQEGDNWPDLVLLKPNEIPNNAMRLQLAVAERFEVGRGYAYARLGRWDKDNNRLSWRDAFSHGEISSGMTRDGLRQFSGNAIHAYWFTQGSSGSPVFLEGGQQLAGILTLSEQGANEGVSPLHEAFLIPATTIRTFAQRLPGINSNGQTSDNINDLRIHVSQFIAGAMKAVDAMVTVTYRAYKGTLTPKQLEEYQSIIAPCRGNLESEHISISIRSSALGTVASKFLSQVTMDADDIEEAIELDRKAGGQQYDNLKKVYVNRDVMIRRLRKAFASIT